MLVDRRMLEYSLRAESVPLSSTLPFMRLLNVARIAQIDVRQSLKFKWQHPAIFFRIWVIKVV